MIRELTDVLADVTYKPRWRFETGDDDEGTWVDFWIDTLDADEHQPATLRIRSYLSPNDLATEHAFLEWLFWRIERIEHHEAEEWLRVRGETVRHPQHA